MTKVRLLTSLAVIFSGVLFLGSEAHAQVAPDYPTGGTGIREAIQSPRSEQSVASPQIVPDRTNTGIGFRSELVSYIRFRMGSVLRVDLGPAVEWKSRGTAWRASSRRGVSR